VAVVSSGASPRTREYQSGRLRRWVELSRMRESRNTQPLELAFHGRIGKGATTVEVVCA
jgi:hypothetical protein